MSRRTVLRRGAQAAAAVAGGRVLSASAARAAAPSPTVVEVPAVVVGSGYGGAVSALRLGQAGVQTLVLEMGRSWTRPGRDGRPFCSTLRPDGRAMWMRRRTKTPLNTMYGIPIDMPIPKYAGVLDCLQHPEMAVYVGRGVGGGSLVNGGMAVTPRREDFERFLPGVDADEMYGKYFPLANAHLKSNEVPQDWFETTPVHQFSRVGRGQAERVGYETAFVPSVYDYGYMQDEVAGHVRRSATNQEVFYGNNGGKQSLDKTYLREALATGKVEIASLRTVTSVTRAADGSFRLTVSQRDDYGRLLGVQEVRCRSLFLAAGCMGTTELLLRARELGTLQGLSGAIGQGWGNNGNVTAARMNRFTTPTGARQTTMPAMGIDARDHPDHRMFVEITPMPTNFENFTSCYLGVTENSERGHLRYNAQTDRADLVWRREQGRPAVNALSNLLGAINHRERTGYRKDLYFGGRTWGDHYTWHPLGGCVLGEATDGFGRARGGGPGLYVNDGSLIPGYASVNPFVTITALAERNIERVLSEDRVG